MLDEWRETEKEEKKCERQLNAVYRWWQENNIWNTQLEERTEDTWLIDSQVSTELTQLLTSNDSCIEPLKTFFFQI